MEDWAELHRRHRAEGLPIKTIARALGVSRNTVRAALASEGPPKYERKRAGSAVDAFEDANPPDPAHTSTHFERTTREGPFCTRYQPR